MSFKKVAIITGGGTGVGKHTALALLDSGYHIVIAGRRTEPLQNVRNEAGQSESKVLTVQTDVSEPQSVRNLFAKAVESFGRVDLLFNNAGTNAPGIALEDLTYAQWRSVIDVNLTGAFLCTQEAFRIMKNQDPMGGRIINNGSISAHTPRPDSAPYTSSKHAITGLTKSTSLDGRKYKIACGQVDIGNAETDMTQRMKAGAKQADGSKKVEPTMDPKHVADAVAYMANLPLSSNILTMTVMATDMPYVGRG